MPDVPRADTRSVILPRHSVCKRRLKMGCYVIMVIELCERFNCAGLLRIVTQPEHPVQFDANANLQLVTNIVHSSGVQIAFVRLALCCLVVALLVLFVQRGLVSFGDFFSIRVGGRLGRNVRLSSFG